MSLNLHNIRLNRSLNRISATGRESTGALPLPPWDLYTRPEDPTATATYTRNYAYDKLGNVLSLQHLADYPTNTQLSPHHIA